MKNNQPEKVYRAGQITATIWKNEREIKGKGVQEFRTVVIDKSYKDDNNQWKRSSNFSLNDLPKVQLVANEAYRYLAMHEYNEESKNEEQSVFDID